MFAAFRQCWRTFPAALGTHAATGAALPFLTTQTGATKEVPMTMSRRTFVQAASRNDDLAAERDRPRQRPRRVPFAPQANKSSGAARDHAGCRCSIVA
jgi:hypothetical protein